MAGIGVWQLLIVLAIIILLFGTKKLRSLGGDVGSAIKNFKNSVREGEEESTSAKTDTPISHNNETTQEKTTTENDKHSS